MSRGKGFSKPLPPRTRSKPVAMVGPVRATLMVVRSNVLTVAVKKPHDLPVQADERRLFGHVASLECQRCGVVGVQVAHSNQLRDGKGRGMKSHPWRVAALCPPCHIEIDSGNTLSKEERREQWDEAHRATLGELFARGLVRPV